MRVASAQIQSFDQRPIFGLVVCREPDTFGVLMKDGASGVANDDSDRPRPWISATTAVGIQVDLSNTLILDQWAVSLVLEIMPIIERSAPNLS